MTAQSGAGARVLIHPAGAAGTAYRNGMAAQREAAAKGAGEPNEMATALALLAATATRPEAYPAPVWEAAGFVHEWKMNGAQR